MSLLVAIGVNSEGYREILGICEGAKEDKAGWSTFLKHLKERGLKACRLSSPMPVRISRRHARRLSEYQEATRTASYPGRRAC